MGKTNAAVSCGLYWRVVVSFDSSLSSKRVFFSIIRIQQKSLGFNKNQCRNGKSAIMERKKRKRSGNKGL